MEGLFDEREHGNTDQVEDPFGFDSVVRKRKCPEVDVTINLGGSVFLFRCRT